MFCGHDVEIGWYDGSSRTFPPLKAGPQLHGPASESSRRAHELPGERCLQTAALDRKEFLRQGFRVPAAQPRSPISPDRDDPFLDCSTTRRVPKRRSHMTIATDHRVLDVPTVDATPAEFPDPHIFLGHIVQRFNQHESVATCAFHQCPLSICRIPACTFLRRESIQYLCRAHTTADAAQWRHQAIVMTGALREETPGGVLPSCEISRFFTVKPYGIVIFREPIPISTSRLD